MGGNTELSFVDPEAAASFDCGICLHKIQNAVAVCEDHLFCEECINDLMYQRGQIFSCPTCRRKCSHSEIKRVKFIDRQIKSLLIKCPNHQITAIKSIYLRKLKEKNKNVRRLQKMTHSQSRRNRSRSRSRSRSRERNDTNELNESEKRKYCEWTGKLERLSEHILNCQHEIIRCQDCDECIERGMKREHAMTCKYHAIECKLCKKMVARIYMDRHRKKEFCWK